MRPRNAIIAALTAAALCVSLSGCGDDIYSKKEQVSLSVMCLPEHEELKRKMTDSFKKKNPHFEYDISIKTDGDAVTDIFMLSDAELSGFINAGKLLEITRNKDILMSINSEGSVEAVSYGGELYAYPMSVDGTYVMYYDKRIISGADTLDAVCEQAVAAGKRVMMDIADGRYLASFFFAADGGLYIDENGKGRCSFNDEFGLAAAETLKKFASTALMQEKTDALVREIGETAAAGVAEADIAEQIMEKLGENFGVIKLPTCTIGDKQRQMGSFASYSLIGINSQTEQPVESMKLAQWISNEENQVIMFEATGTLPGRGKYSHYQAR